MNANKTNSKRVPKNTETLAMYRRFIEVFDYLLDNGLMENKRSYCTKVGLNRVRINGIKKLITTGDSAYQTLASEAVLYLCRDFNVSAEWLLFGRGKMFTHVNPVHHKNSATQAGGQFFATDAN